MIRNANTPGPLVHWTGAKETGTLPRKPEQYPPLLAELQSPAGSGREVARASIDSALDLVLFPTLGCFQPGYLLVSPTREVFSYAELSTVELDKVSHLVNRWRALLDRLMGETILAENGSSATSDRSAACNSLAHLHLLPVPGLGQLLQERYYQACGKPDETINQLSDLPNVVAGAPYVLFSHTPDQYEVWLDVERFSRQFVRREAASLLGIPNFYNWRIHPFVEQMELSQTLLGPVFRAEGNAVDGQSRDVNVRWETPYDLPEPIDPLLNPHVTLFGEQDAERLLFFAGCRARGIAEEAFDQLRRLHKAGTLNEFDRTRAVAAAQGPLRKHFDTCTSRAALDLLKALGQVPDPLPNLYGPE